MKHVITETRVDNSTLVLVATLVALWTLSVLIGIVFFVGATA